MSRLEDLPPDLRAVLSLLLRQRRGYAEIAGLLGISASAVHDRAHAALALLAPRQARALTADQREQIGECLLGHQPPAQQLQTRALLENSVPGQQWAQALVQEMAPLADGPQSPEIPPAPYEPPPEISPAPRRAPTGGPASPVGPPPARPPSSRTGGAIVLGAIAAAVVVAVVLILGVGGGGSHGATSSTGTSAATTGTNTTKTSSTSKTGAKPKIGKPLQLTPPEPGTSKAVGSPTSRKAANGPLRDAQAFARPAAFTRCG